MPDTHSRNLGLRNFFPPFLLGFLSLSIQVIFLREFSAYFQGNELTFGFCLGAWLLWVGIGSLLGPRLKYQTKRFFRAYFLYLGGTVGVFILLRLSRFILSLHPGEPASLFTLFLASLVYCFFLGFPLGVLFVWNVYYLEGQLEKVYLREALGSFVGGTVVYFFTLPYLSNWQSLTLIGLLTCVVSFTFWPLRDQLWLRLGVVALLAFFTLGDFPVEKLYWAPFTLVASQDSLYGKLGVIASEEQITMYSNHTLFFSFPDRENAEEIIHFTLSQRPEARHILLIGGGLGGPVTEILKYPFSQVDYVEIDPELIELGLHYLPPEERQSFNSPRINLKFTDGRAFLRKTTNRYDVIIVNLPDPINAQLNRFYTLEFFQLIKKRLLPGGVFSFRVSSSENYISTERQLLLTSLYHTLQQVFATVRVVPGGSNIYLASETTINLKPTYLSETFQTYKIAPRFLTKSYLNSRLNPLRLEMLSRALEAKTSRFNTDLTPICYFFTALLWSKQFSHYETSVFSFLARQGNWWLLDFPLILLFSTLLLLWFFSRKRVYFSLFPLICMGFTSIVTEIVLIISFQAKFGYLYHAIALLFSTFMLGLYLGALVSQRISRNFSTHLFLLLAALIIILRVILWILHHSSSVLFYYGAFLVLGYLGGDIFITATRLYLQTQTHMGLSYAFDLLGSFAGALGVSSLIIPLFGLNRVINYLIILNSGALILLFWLGRTRPIQRAKFRKNI